MMICCFTEISTNWDSDKLGQNLGHVPGPLRESILLKRNKRDQILSLCGKLLLIELLTHFNSELTLADLKYDSYQRPYFNETIDFNISHSGNLAMCVMTDKEKVGADVEAVNIISFDDYTAYFTGNEWQSILNATDPLNTFYAFWTRKEAVLKAAGTGLYTPLQQIDVSAENVLCNNYLYYLSPANISPRYQCHIASTVKQDIDFYRVDL